METSCCQTQSQTTAMPQVGCWHASLLRLCLLAATCALCVTVMDGGCLRAVRMLATPAKTHTGLHPAKCTTSLPTGCSFNESNTQPADDFLAGEEEGGDEGIGADPGACVSTLHFVAAVIVPAGCLQCSSEQCAPGCCFLKNYNLTCVASASRLCCAWGLHPFPLKRSPSSLCCCASRPARHGLRLC